MYVASQGPGSSPSQRAGLRSAEASGSLRASRYGEMAGPKATHLPVRSWGSDSTIGVLPSLDVVRRLRTGQNEESRADSGEVLRNSGERGNQDLREWGVLTRSDRLEDLVLTIDRVNWRTEVPWTLELGASTFSPSGNRHAMGYWPGTVSFICQGSMPRAEGIQYRRCTPDPISSDPSARRTRRSAATSTRPA